MILIVCFRFRKPKTRAHSELNKSKKKHKSAIDLRRDPIMQLGDNRRAAKRKKRGGAKTARGGARTARGGARTARAGLAEKFHGDVMQNTEDGQDLEEIPEDGPVTARRKRMVRKKKGAEKKAALPRFNQVDIMGSMKRDEQGKLITRSIKSVFRSAGRAKLIGMGLIDQTAAKKAEKEKEEKREEEKKKAEEKAERRAARREAGELTSSSSESEKEEDAHRGKFMAKKNPEQRRQN